MKPVLERMKEAKTTSLSLKITANSMEDSGVDDDAKRRNQAVWNEK